MPGAASRRKQAHRNSGLVWMNWPSSAGNCCSLLNTGAETDRPSRVQKPEVVKGVKGLGMPSSFTSAKMLGYCTCHGTALRVPVSCCLLAATRAGGVAAGLQSGVMNAGSVTQRACWASMQDRMQACGAATVRDTRPQ